MAEHEPPRLRVLTVCTGNICRSALAEALLKHRLGDLPEVVVESAGTMAVVGAPMDARAAAYARELGADPTHHRGRQLTEQQLHSSDLILVMSEEHRAVVLDYAPSAARRTFTLRGFARIVSELDAPSQPPRANAGWLTALTKPDLPQTGVSALIESAASHPTRVPSARDRTTQAEEVPDPYRRSDEEYAAAVALIVPAVDSIATALRRALTE